MALTLYYLGVAVELTDEPNVRGRLASEFAPGCCNARWPDGKVYTHWRAQLRPLSAYNRPMKFTITGEVECKEPSSQEPDEIAGAIRTAMAEMGFHFGPGPDERVEVTAIDVEPVAGS